MAVRGAIVLLPAMLAFSESPVDRAKAEIDASDDLTMLERQEFASKVTEQWGNIEWERNSLLVNQTREDRLRFVDERLHGRCRNAVLLQACIRRVKLPNGTRRTFQAFGSHRTHWRN